MSDTLRWGEMSMLGGQRREEIRRRHRNGLAGVELRPGDFRPRLLLTFFAPPPGITVGNLRIDGPPHTPPVRAVHLHRVDDTDHRDKDQKNHRDDRDDTADGDVGDWELPRRQLLVTLDRAGGPGRYRVRLVGQGPHGTAGEHPPPGVDPLYAAAWFSFTASGSFPAHPRPGSAPAAAESADIGYLARDYEGFRQLMLDRLATTAPDWTERHAADIGVMLVELLAYTADDLSYYQDAVATEAYLQTARRRISVRRHGRLVGYRLPEGTNARVWVCLQVAGEITLAVDDLAFGAAGTLPPGTGPVIDPTAATAPPAAAITPFRALHGHRFPPEEPRPGTADTGRPAVTLRPAHYRIDFWTFGEHDATLAEGSTSAVFRDDWVNPPAPDAEGQRQLQLHAGDVLLLEEITDPAGPAADPAHRHPVRLTAVRAWVDELYGQPVVQVNWSAEDALPFPLPVAVPTAGGGVGVRAVAHGNVVLAEHGRIRTETVTVPGAVLSTGPLGHAAAFPDPAVVAHQQAHRLRRLYQDWRDMVERWWRTTRAGVPLTDHQLTELGHPVGAEHLARLGLRRGPGDTKDAERSREHAAAQAAGLHRLLLQADRLLAGPAARLTELADTAERCGPLDRLLLGEVRARWGTALAALLDPDHPRLWGPAAAATTQDPRAALPVIELTDPPAAAAADPQRPARWRPVPDLLDSDPADRHVVVEIDDNHRGHLRFDEHAPLPGGGTLTARYLVGNGPTGRVPAEAINVLLLPADAAAADQSRAAAAAVLAVRNPLPATGGTAPETLAAAKRAIPGAWTAGQRRALNADDYAAKAGSVPGVRRAAAVLGWTGAAVAVDVAVQPLHGPAPTAALLREVRDTLEPVRRVGHRLSLGGPRYRPLFLRVRADLAAQAIRSDATRAVTLLLGDGWLADGSPALFHPSRLGFGQPVFASAVTAAVQAVPGVVAVTVTGFALDVPAAPAAAVPARVVPGPRDVIRVDNDPAAPENGWAAIDLQGGR